MESKIDEIKIRILKSDTVGVFHDSRHDVRILAKMVNALIDKTNELIKEINLLKHGK